jgi:hypothetical protein
MRQLLDGHRRRGDYVKIKEKRFPDRFVRAIFLHIPRRERFEISVITWRVKKTWLA